MNQQMTAVRSTKDIPAEELLGYLTFQNIDEVRIHKDELGKLFDDYQIPRTFLPHEIKPHDAYRRASAKAAATIEIDGGKKARLLVREVMHNNDKIIRHLVREIVDEKNVALDYATVGTMEFDRIAKTMVISWDSAYQNEYDYKKHLQDINDLFMEWTEFHTKDTVRTIVTRITTSMNPVSVQKGGRATFIPKHSKDLLMNLKEAVSKLPKSNSSIEILPLVDAEEARELIAKRAEEAMTGEMEDLILALDKTASVEQLKRYTAKFIDIQKRVKQYQGLLNRNMGIANQQLQEALNRVSEISVKGNGDE